MSVRSGTREDVDIILELYREVAEEPGGLARQSHEITRGYVESCVAASLASGILLVAERDGKLVGEIHAMRKGIACFDHILSDLTIVVSLDEQGRGIGRDLFEAFMERVQAWEDVARVELIARESNQRAIAFYRTLGFRPEGRLENRIKNSDGRFEADIPMAWLRD